MKVINNTKLMSKTGVYQIRNIRNNKIYIGSTVQSFNKRLKRHLYDLHRNLHHSVILQRAWNKYGEDSFEFSIIELCSAKNLIKREQYWLDRLKSYDTKIGYNILVNAGNSTGFKHSEETLILIGQLSKHKDNSKAVAAMKKANLGSKRDEAHSIRMSKTHSKPIIQLDLQGKFLKEWNSGTEIKTFYNLGMTDSNIYKCCSGKCKSYIGFMWVRKKDYKPEEIYVYNPIINGIK